MLASLKKLLIIFIFFDLSDGQSPELIYIPFRQSLTISVGYECDARLLQDTNFRHCLENAYEFWYTNDDYYRLKYSCCYNWDIFDCMEYSIKNLCSFKSYSIDYKNFMIKRDEWVIYYESYQCNVYKYGSAKCHFPVWAIVLIVIGVTLIVVSLIVVVVMVLKNRFKNRGK